MSIWYDERMCGTHHMRNAICVFGLEDLASRLALLPHLFANKLLPEFDFGAMVCWYESIFNRTHLVGEDGDGVSKEGGLDRVLHHRQFYADLPTVSCCEE
jgi:hypothetical protein